MCIYILYLLSFIFLFSTAKENQYCRFFLPYVNDGRFPSISGLVPAKHRITEWLRLTETSGGHLVHPSAQAAPPEASCPGPRVGGS